MFAVRRLLVCLTLIQCLALPASAESPKSLAHNLKGKTVFLRGMYVESNLTFDAQGNLIGEATPGPFFTSAIKVEDASARGSTLEIDGTRASLINTSASDNPSTRDIHIVPVASKVHITINGDPAHPDALPALMNKILATSIDEALAGKTEDQRKTALFALGYTPRPGETPTQSSSPTEIPDPANPGSTIKVYKMHPRSMVNPRAIFTVDPEYSDYARKKKINGVCILEMIVDTNGFPMRVHITRSIDPGLDENAIAAVSQYRFTPAMMNGTPIAVQIAVEVSFRLY